MEPLAWALIVLLGSSLGAVIVMVILLVMRADEPGARARRRGRSPPKRQNANARRTADHA